MARTYSLKPCATILRHDKLKHVSGIKLAERLTNKYLEINENKPHIPRHIKVNTHSRKYAYCMDL